MRPLKSQRLTPTVAPGKMRFSTVVLIIVKHLALTQTRLVIHTRAFLLVYVNPDSFEIKMENALTQRHVEIVVLTQPGPAVG